MTDNNSDAPRSLATPTRTDNQPRGRARQILAAAARIFGTGGPTAVTHRAVAAEAGVSLGLTTYYFKDRQDLLLQAMRHAYTVESARLRACVAEVTTPLPVDDCVHLLTEMFFDKTVADPLYDITLFEMFLEATRTPSVRALTQEWTTLILELIDQVLPPTDPSLPRSQVVQIVAAQVDGLMLEETSNQSLGLEGLSEHLRLVISRFVA